MPLEFIHFAAFKAQQKPFVSLNLCKGGLELHTSSPGLSQS